MTYSPEEYDFESAKLLSLGAGFVTDNHMITDPEKTIIDGLDYFWKSNSLFTMLLGVLEHRIHHLINVERLTSLAKEIDEDKKIILMVIADKMLKKGDKRFHYLIKNLKKRGQRLKKETKIFKNKNRLIAKHGLDSSFKKFHIDIPNLLKERENKFYPLKKIIAQHPWLRIRNLMGTSHRSDISYLLANQLASTPQQASKILGCHRSIAYHYWKLLEPIPHLSKNPLFT